MSQDLGTIQYKVDADTTGLDKANAATDNMAKKAVEAGDAVDVLAKKTTRLTEEQKRARLAAQELEKAQARTNNTIRQAGFQLQDSVVQLQNGTKASVVFAQQGSQLLSVIHPMLGLAAALAGVIGGALYSALTNGSTATEGLSESIKKLHKEYADLDVFQQQHLVNDEIKKQEDSKKAIAETEKQINKLTEAYRALEVENGKRKTVFTGGTGGGSAQELVINNTREMAKVDRELTAARANLSTQNDTLAESEKEIQRIRGLEVEDSQQLAKKANDLIKQLRTQTETYGLVGAALGEYTANKLKASEANHKEIVSLMELAEQQKKQTEAEREAAAEKKKAEQQELSRSETIKKLTAQMQREADLFGVTTKASQLEYDITHDLIKVKDGLAGTEGRLMMIQAKRIDQMQDEKNLAEALDAEIDSRLANEKKFAKEASKFTADAMERINAAGADAWVGFADGSKSAFDGIKKAFLQMLGEMAHEAVTKPIVMNIQQSMMGANANKAGGAASAVGAGGWYAAIALVVAGAISESNKQQAKKFDEMKAAYRQANQSIGTVLGDESAKSESISKSLEYMEKYQTDTLGVNQNMLLELKGIRTSLSNVAAGFAKQFGIIGIAGANGISQGKSTLGINNRAIEFGEKSSETMADPAKLFGDQIQDFVKGLGTGITNKIVNAVYNKKIKITDTGIQLAGQTLAEIYEKGVLGAFTYADTQTTKKFLGINLGSKVKTQTEKIDAIVAGQFADVFKGAGDILRDSSEQFGVDFNKYVSKLVVDPQKLSLKDLKGDALEKEIEKFFSSTVDKWATALLFGTDVLEKFQKVGEGAFETYIRLANETKTFNGYVDQLGLNLHVTGVNAVEAVQGIADAAGGFDSLTSSLNTYADKFLSDSDKFNDLQKRASDYLGSLGVALPQTRDQFKSVVQAIDLTTDAGQKQFAALIKVSGAVDDYITKLEKQRKAIVDSSYSGLTRSVDAQKKIISAQMNAVNASLTSAQAVYSALSSTLNGMVIDSKQTESLTRRQAQNQLQDALSGAKNGILPNLDKLSSALSTVSKPSESLYRTFQDYAEDFYKTAGTIKQLQDAAGTQVSTEEKALEQLQKQSDDLDNMLVWAKMQVDILNGIDVSVMSVAAALDIFGSALGIDTSSQNIIAMAAASNGTAGGTPAQQAAQQAAQKAADDQARKDKENQDFMRASQIAIADSTNKIYKILDKFDAIGMPPVREEA